MRLIRALVAGNAYAPHVMVMGGHNPATPTAEIIDLSEPTPRCRAVPSMGSARIEMNAVLLPTGKVLALGGSVKRNDATTASLAAQMSRPTAVERRAPHR